MIEGETVRLRVWQESDLPVLTSVRNDVALQAQLLARVRGSTVEQVREWLEGRSAHPEQLLWIITDRRDDGTLGFVQLTHMDALNRRADLGICLIREAQGRGIGGEALRLLFAHLKDAGKLRKINLTVRADNAAAIRCYEQAGFERCGLLHENEFIEGAWQDIVLMERFLAAGH